MSRYFAEQLRNGSYHVRDRQDGNRLVYDKERDGNDKPIVVSEDNIEECLRDLNEKETNSCDVPVVLPHRSILKRETAIAQSHEAAERVFELLESLSILPPEFKADYLRQARLIAGIAGTINQLPRCADETNRRG